ncbi:MULTISPECIES: DUF7824 domain-containing protein [unclassified Streptosporangium]|uniref:DUF7824 domain-containing protein n=1 Tax=unclassified Streptosporangium TaxID=2632669 RepID=UPI002E2B98CC|nr:MULTISPECIES: DUF6493 family protein [unclassified Streptosporangium]
MEAKDVRPAAWDGVRALIDTGDVAGIVKAVTALDDAGRREVARELPGYVTVLQEREQRSLAEREARLDRARQDRQEELLRWRDTGEISEDQYQRAWSMTWDDYDGWEGASGGDGWIEPMRIAGAGTIGGAAAVVTWINRREFERWDLDDARVVDGIEPLLEVIASRPAAWQADLAVRVALRLRPRRRRAPRDRNLPLAFALLRRTGATPPAHDPLVVGWVSRDARLGELRADPLLDHLLPRLFEAEGIGRALRDERSGPGGTTRWLGALRTLAAEGRVPRELLLNGCRSRFLRGGEGPDLRFFARLHELLDPTPAEIEPHAVDYLRLLPTAPGPVAELSLKHVRRLDGLDPADVVEALEGLLFRAEGGLVRTGLAWLEESIRRSPGRADELAPALAMAFGHEARAVRERAVRLAVRHAAHLTALGAEILRGGMGTLTPDLHNRLAAAVGGERVEEPEPASVPEPAPEEVFVPRRLPDPPRPVPVVAPPDTPGQLAGMYRRDGWRVAERRLSAFVRLAARDRESLRAALTPLFAREEEPWHPDEWREHGDWMTAFAAELADPGRTYETGRVAFVNRARRERGLPPVVYEEPDHLPERRRASPLHRFVLLRHAEILDALRAGTLPPLLLATPTLSNGLLDPAELVSRLETLEAADVTPLSADFQQALLRLPRRVDPAVTVRAEALRSEAGRRAARWMAEGGLPDPVVRVTRSGENDGLGSSVWMACTVQAEPTGLPLVDELLADQPRHVNFMADGHLGGLMEWWAAVLPSHREVVAAHLVPHQPVPDWSAAMDSLRLVDLAAAEGPAGRAVAVLLAHRTFPGPFAHDDSLPAFTALRQLAAAGDLPAEEIGAELAERVVRGEITPKLLLGALEAEAADGAHREMWRILAVALPSMLPAPDSRPTPAHADLVARAARLARWARARGRIPALTELAARKGRSHVFRHARALDDQLASPAADTDG